jgi:hypothetical protein
MSFADPTAVLLGATVTPSGGTSTSYASQDRSAPYTGKYGTSDGLNRMRITHTLGSKKRSEFRLEQDKSYTDPTTGLVSTITTAAYLVLNRPNAGFTNAELKAILAGVCGFVGVSGNQDKLLGLES